MRSTQAERAFGDSSLRFVIGIDEAGRGCMAGPVSVAAVCFAVSDRSVPFSVEDSKVMTATAREAAFAQLCAALRPADAALGAPAALERSISDGCLCLVSSSLADTERTVLGFASALIPAAEIDRVNILNATLEGMACVAHTLTVALREAGVTLTAANTVILIDGPHKPWTFLPHEERVRKIKLALKRHEQPPRCEGRMYPNTLQALPCATVIGGDGRCVSIATASVVAKVTRDAYAARVMEPQCPQYGFAQHKGYCTADHKKALAQHGLSVFHRREYAPVKAIANMVGKKGSAAPPTRRKRQRCGSDSTTGASSRPPT